MRERVRERGKEKGRKGGRERKLAYREKEILLSWHICSKHTKAFLFQGQTLNNEPQGRL